MVLILLAHNGDPNDDFRSAKTNQNVNLEEFTESWRLGDQAQCTHRPPKKHIIENCQKLPILKQFAAHKACSLFKESPEFIKCHPIEDPEFYLESCLNDECSQSCPGGSRCGCASLRNYATTCAKKGVKIHWGEHKLCSVKCPKGQEWVECTDKCHSCKKFWLNQNSGKTCGSSKKCRPGCQCTQGKIKYKHKCIKPTSCPLKYKLQGLPVEYFQQRNDSQGRKRLKQIQKQLKISRKDRRHKSRILDIIKILQRPKTRATSRKKTRHI